ASLLSVSLGVCQLLLQSISDQSSDLPVVQSGLELNLEPVIFCLEFAIGRAGVLRLRVRFLEAFLQGLLLAAEFENELFRLVSVELFAVFFPWHLAIVLWHCILLGCCTGRKALLRPTGLSYTSPCLGTSARGALPVPAPALPHIDSSGTPKPRIATLDGLPCRIDAVSVPLNVRGAAEYRHQDAPAMIVALRRQLAGEYRRRQGVLNESRVHHLERVDIVDHAARLQHRAEVAGIHTLGDPSPADGRLVRLGRGASHVHARLHDSASRRAVDGIVGLVRL